MTLEEFELLNLMFKDIDIIEANKKIKEVKHD